MIVNLICHTDGCENAEIVIPFTDPLDMVICGPCGQEITDKVALDG